MRWRGSGRRRSDEKQHRDNRLALLHLCSALFMFTGSDGVARLESIEALRIIYKRLEMTRNFSYEALNFFKLFFCV